MFRGWGRDRILKVVKWVAIGIALFSVTSCVIQYYRFGYFTLPDLPNDSYILTSDGNGIRGIVTAPGQTSSLAEGEPGLLLGSLSDYDPTRRFLPLPFIVAEGLEHEWSACTPPSARERVFFQRSLPAEWQDYYEFARLDFVCRLDVDGETVYRGIIYSEPRE